MMFIAVQVLSQLTVWQKLEIFCIVIGLGLLVIGHLGWCRGRDREDDVVSFCLTIGSLRVPVHPEKTGPS